MGISPISSVFKNSMYLLYTLFKLVRVFSSLFNKLFMTGSSPTNHENYAILSQVVSMPEGRLQIGARKPAINLTWTS